jgi:beta-xylosidase
MIASPEIAAPAIMRARRLIVRAGNQNGDSEHMHRQQQLDAEQHVIQRGVSEIGEDVVDAGNQQAPHGGEHQRTIEHRRFVHEALARIG